MGEGIETVRAVLGGKRCFCRHVRGIAVILLVGVSLAVTGGIFMWHSMRADESRDTNEKAVSQEELVIYSSHPVDFMRPLIEEFESRTGIRVSVENGGSGELLDKVEAEAESENPKVDILWGGSLSTLKPQSYLFEEYESANEVMVQEKFRNTEGMLTRFSNIPSILFVNEDLIGNIKISGYEDLLNLSLKGKIAYCDPAVSSSAYEHLINMLYAMGNGNPDNGWEFVEKFCENLDGHLLKSSAEVYEGVAAGEYVIGLTFEEAAAALASEGEHVGIVYMKEGVLCTPDCVCMIKQAPNKENAKKFIDFVTGYEAQMMIAFRLNRRSVRIDVDTPEGLAKSIPELIVEEEVVSTKKKEWIEHFETILENESEMKQEAILEDENTMRCEATPEDESERQYELILEDENGIGYEPILDDRGGDET